MQPSITREEFRLSFKGNGVDNHEIDVASLVDSLIAMKSLAEKANALVNGKNTDIYVKVKGGFEKGSFEFSMLFEWGMACAPIVAYAATCVAPVLTTIVHTINLGKMMRGEKPNVVSRNNDTTTVQNSFGQSATFNDCVINLYNSSSTKQDLSKLTNPFEKGIDTIDIIPHNQEDVESTSLTMEDRESFLPQEGDKIDESTKRCLLELLTPNFDGKPTGWRFSDIEDSCEFTATIADELFLDDVRAGKHKFTRGSSLDVTLATTKKIVNQRKRTERTIKEVFKVE